MERRYIMTNMAVVSWIVLFSPASAGKDRQKDHLYNKRRLQAREVNGIPDIVGFLYSRSRPLVYFLVCIIPPFSPDFNNRTVTM